MSGCLDDKKSKGQKSKQGGGAGDTKSTKSKKEEKKQAPKQELAKRKFCLRSLNLTMSSRFLLLQVNFIFEEVK